MMDGASTSISALRDQAQTSEHARSFSEAISFRERCCEREPDSVIAWYELGATLFRADRFDASLSAFQRAVELAPDFTAAVVGCGNAHVMLGNCIAAADYLLRATKLDVGDKAIFVSLVELTSHLIPRFKKAGLHTELAELLHEVTTRLPDAALFYQFAHHLIWMGRIEEAIACFVRATEIEPNNQHYIENLIIYSDAAPNWDLGRMQAARRNWAMRFADPLLPFERRPVDRGRERPLRVGYVSSCFWRHPGSSVFGPVLLGHDPAQISTVCLNSSRTKDDVTELFQRRASEWHDVQHLPDNSFAARVASLNIDILVDLDGFGDGNRLRAFARRPAPIQVHAWGHATGTGMAAMDYFFADPLVIPAEDRPLFSEAIVDLPCFLGFTPLADPTPVVPLPALTNGFVTFGSLHRHFKLSDSTCQAWAHILRAIPSARLLIKASNFENPWVRKSFAERFAAQGGDADRLIFRGQTSPEEHRATCNEIDIALDAWPVGGGTTTAEALWMGVPVLSLAWPTTSGRNGLSVMTAVGLPDWVARTQEEYVRIAVEKATDLAELARLRMKLRSQLENSAVGNSEAYVRAVEQAYRAIWHRWLDNHPEAPPVGLG